MRKKNIKKRSKIILLSIALVLVVAVIALGVSVLLEEDSEEETACEEITYEEIADEEIRIPVRFQVLSEEDQHTIIQQTSVEVTDYEKIENLTVLEEVKKELTEFLAKKYQYDADKKLSKVTFYQYEGKEVDYTEISVTGFYEEGTADVVLNSFILANWSEDDIKSVVAHELLHYLGFTSIDEYHWMLYEAATAAVTDEFVKWAAYNITQVDIYETTMRLIQQMELCNPNLIYNHLHEIQRIDENVDEILADAVYPYYDTNGFTTSQLLGVLLQGIVVYGGDFYTLFTAQEITEVYCRNFDVSDDAQNQYKDLYIITNFDQVYLVKNGDVYEPYMQ